MASARSRTRLIATLAALLAAALLGACQGPPSVQVPSPDAYPQRLSEWGLLQRRGDALVLGRGVTPYDVNTPLFSDYALKLRTYYLPDGEKMTYRNRGSFEFPVGSVISKTFFYPLKDASARDGVIEAWQGWNGDAASLDLGDYRLVETRLLVRRPEGWDALPYVWDGDDAYLRITGALLPMRIEAGGDLLDLPYVVPARSECAGCHATDHTAGKLTLIGFRARHVNRRYPGSSRNQLSEWAERGRLADLPDIDEVPRNAVWNDPGAPLADRARAYLDSNCGHCHNPAGAADTSGLWLDAHTTDFRHLGFCKPPIAAGKGTGGRRFAIMPGAPDQSILIYRLQTDDPASRMPEAGRALTHREGVELMQHWVESLPGTCL